MADIQKCLICTPANQLAAQQLCVSVAGIAGDGMFLCPLYAAGNPTPVGYITEGVMREEIVNALVAANLADATNETPKQAMQRLNLQLEA